MTAGPLPRLVQHYPLVTTGGGALPLPTYCAKAETLKRVTAAAVSIATAFMMVLPLGMTN